MPVEVVEKFESRQVTTGQSPAVELRYVIRGTNDDAEARTALVEASPITYDPWGGGLLFLPRDTVTVQPVGDLLWEGIVRYGPVPQTGDVTATFDITGETYRRLHTIQTVGSYAPAGQTAPATHGLIGQTPDGVEGVELQAAVYNFTETHYFADAVVTEEYRKTLADLFDHVNQAPFRGFPAGEVVFAGATGQQRASGDWQITFHFSRHPNVTGQTIDEISGIDKKGWEYLWLRHKTVKDDVTGWPAEKPIAVYVEKVRETGDFSTMLI